MACPEDEVALAAALLQLLRNEGLRQRRGVAALRRARLDMDPERAARAVRAFYQRTLEAHDEARA